MGRHARLEGRGGRGILKSQSGWRPPRRPARPRYPRSAVLSCRPRRLWRTGVRMAWLVLISYAAWFAASLLTQHHTPRLKRLVQRLDPLRLCPTWHLFRTPPFACHGGLVGPDARWYLHGLANRVHGGAVYLAGPALEARGLPAAAPVQVRRRRDPSRAGRGASHARSSSQKTGHVWYRTLPRYLPSARLNNSWRRSGELPNAGRL